MDATPSNPGRYDVGGGDRPASGPPLPRATDTGLGRRWSALHEASSAVGAIAGLASEPLPAAVHDFPRAVARAGGWRRERAEQGVDDLAAIMELGLAALLTAHARGANPAPAAQALWREFTAARDALLALAPPLN